MLEAVGHPYAVNADRALRKIAAERDWPVLTFSNAVPLARADLRSASRAPGGDRDGGRRGRRGRGAALVRLAHGAQNGH